MNQNAFLILLMYPYFLTSFFLSLCSRCCSTSGEFQAAWCASYWHSAMQQLQIRMMMIFDVQSVLLMFSWTCTRFIQGVYWGVPTYYSLRTGANHTSQPREVTQILRLLIFTNRAIQPQRGWGLPQARLSERLRSVWAPKNPSALLGLCPLLYVVTHWGPS